MEKSEKFWDRAAGDFTDQEQHTQLHENKDFITTLKYLNTDYMVLDYGCATGIISNAIADKVKEVHAIDISSRMIEIAKIKAGRLNINNVHYAQALIFDERYVKESFDVILAFRILHILDDIEAVISRINNLLKPGGVFISVTTCMGSYKAIFSFPAFLLRKLSIIPFRINFFRLPEVQELLSTGGFKIVEFEKMDDKVPTYCIVARKVKE